MAAVSQGVAQIREAVARLIADGLSEGIELDGPLGRWLGGQAQALEALADVLDGQSSRFEEIVARIDAAADVEIRKLATAIEAARKLMKQGELALAQARNAELALVVHKEELTIRMIRETLPLFADRLHDALVIREHRWNRESLFRRYALVAGAVLGVFVCGYLVAAWQGDNRIMAFDDCVVHPIQSGGHVYCNIDSWFPRSPR
ncbi:MAG: hypothetical protein ACREFP_23935 [Acetobacteraceae bacterium]